MRDSAADLVILSAWQFGPIWAMIGLGSVAGSGWPGMGGGAMSELEPGQGLVPEVHLESADMVAPVHLESGAPVASQDDAAAESEIAGSLSDGLES